MEMLVEGRQLFAVRTDNSIHAYWNICPHMGDTPELGAQPIFGFR